jgi:ketopantoate hydroxymethyltransferase
LSWNQRIARATRPRPEGASGMSKSHNSSCGRAAVRAYCDEVRAGQFPTAEHGFK